MTTEGQPQKAADALPDLPALAAQKKRAQALFKVAEASAEAQLF